MNWTSLVLNWKTSSAGFLALLTAAGHLAYAYSTNSFDPNMALTDVMAILVGFGLLAAKDATAPTHTPVPVKVII